MPPFAGADLQEVQEESPRLGSRRIREQASKSIPSRSSSAPPPVPKFFRTRHLNKMGGNFSKSSLPAYEEAVERLGYTHVARIREGFARLAVKEGALQRSEFRSGFLNSIAGAPVPENFSTALFNAFDTTARGHLTVEEFVCSLAILRHGTPEEKLRLLFTVYDVDRDKKVSDSDLANFAHALEDGRRNTRTRAVEEALQKLSNNGPTIGFKHFSSWANKHMDSPLISWIFDIERKLASELGEVKSKGHRFSSNRMFPKERTLSAEFREDQKELEKLHENLDVDVELARELRTAWHCAVDKSKFGVVDLEAFSSQLGCSLPEDLRQCLFVALDQSGSGTLSLQEWVHGAHTCLAGKSEAQVDLCFRMLVSPSIKSCFPDAHPSDEIKPPLNVEDAIDIAIDPVMLDLFSHYSTGCLAFISGKPRPRQNKFWNLDDEPERTCEVQGPTKEEFSQEPWFSKACEFMLSLGRFMRIDLPLPPVDSDEEAMLISWFNREFDPERPGQEGDTWYLITARWWGSWSEAMKHGLREDLPSIDNSSLLEHFSLRIGLNHRIDYELVTETAWNAFVAWYGGPGPPLPRRVIKLDGQLELEMYPLRIHVFRTDGSGEVLLLEREMEISRLTSLADAMEMGCNLHQITHRVNAFHRTNANIEWEKEGNTSRTLHYLGFVDGHQLLLHKQEPPDTTTAIQSGLVAHAESRVDGIGLQNLGNTCYMNASLQCLVHTPLLPAYFGTDYRPDVNTESTWGMGGKLAVAFSDFITDMNSARAHGSGIVAPRPFRRAIGEFSSQFAGWRQQDAQEFLSIFLTGLSEDVNRTYQKPYVELKDSGTRSDEKVAEEFWEAHCRRENSVVFALFSSQFKSVVKCKACGYTNATFDPFQHMPIPLPQHDFRWVTCNVARVPKSGNYDQHTIQVCARVKKAGKISDMLQAVAGLVDLPADELLAGDVGDGYIFRMLDKSMALASLSEDVQPLVYHAPMPLFLPPFDSDVFASTKSFADARSLPAEPSLVLSCASMDTPYATPRTSTTGIGAYNSTCSARSTPASNPSTDIPPEAETNSMVTVYFVHRRMRKVERYFLDPYTPEIFGTPVVLRLPAVSSTCFLYHAVLNRIKHVVPDVGSEDNFPFALSRVKRDGSTCATCNWREGCAGCRITTRANAKPVFLKNDATLGIDWDAHVLEKHYKTKVASHIHVHESVEFARIERNTPESLKQCLEALVQQEELVMYCKECSKNAGGDFTETTHTKAFKIWACGPILVMHLKRFHHDADGTSYKLHNLVTFPMHLDLRAFLAEAVAADPADSHAGVSARDPALNAKDVMQYNPADRSSTVGVPLSFGCRVQPPEESKTASPNASQCANSPSRSLSRLADVPMRSRTSSGKRLCCRGSDDEDPSPSACKGRNSDRSQSESNFARRCWNRSPKPESESHKDSDDHKAAGSQKHTVFQTLARDAPCYDLYGVVNHIGSIGSGHYTSFVRQHRANGQKRAWLCCDDSRVYKVSEEDVVTANAYLLFYMRKDVADCTFKLENVFPIRTASGGATSFNPEHVKAKPWVRPSVRQPLAHGPTSASTGPAALKWPGGSGVGCALM